MGLERARSGKVHIVSGKQFRFRIHVLRSLWKVLSKEVT